MRLQFFNSSVNRKSSFNRAPSFNRVFSPSHLPHPLQLGLAWPLSFTASGCRVLVLFVDFALTGGFHYPGVLGRGHVCMYLPLSRGLAIRGLTYVVHRWWQEEVRPYVSWGQRRLELPCGSSTLHVYLDVYLYCGGF